MKEDFNVLCPILKLPWYYWQTEVKFSSLAKRGILMTSAQDYFDSLMGLAMAKQCAFADTVPDHWSTWKWSTEGQRFLVTLPSVGTYEAQYLGTESYITNTWLHAWANESLHPLGKRASLAFKEHLEKSWSHPAFVTPQQPLTVVNGDYIGVIATQLLNASTYLALPNENGLLFIALFDLPPLLNFSPTPLGRIDLVFEMIDGSSQVFNRELAHRNYFEAEGFTPTRTALAGGYRDVFLDKLGREIIYEVTNNVGRDNQSRKTIAKTTSMDIKHARKAPSFDCNSQWDWCLRAPLNRVAPNFAPPPKEQQIDWSEMGFPST